MSDVRPARPADARSSPRVADRGRSAGGRVGRPVEVAPGLELVALRPLVRKAPIVWLPLAPGDRPIVVPGEAVPRGGILGQRIRSAALLEVAAAAVADDAVPGTWWEDDGRRHGVRRAPAGADEGELLYRSGGEWRVVAGDRSDLLEAPAAGIVREVRPGVGIGFETASSALVGVRAVGGPARGRLEVVGAADGELRPGMLDVGRAGAIVVAGSRIDAEMLTRARAMGIHGVVAASIATRDLRDIAASEARQRASLQPLAPFAILVLEGHLRAPVAGPVMAILHALAGRDVAIVGDPPLLLFDPPAEALPLPSPGHVRVRHGPAAGREGRWLGRVGRRRFAAGVHLEAGLVDVGDDRPVTVALADLERFA